jgi:hypothetical protein
VAEAGTQPTAEFFRALGARGNDPALEGATGTLRFDLAGSRGSTARWLVTMNRGDVAISRKNAKADCVVRSEEALFDRIVSGRANMLASMLRGALDAEGDLALLVLFQRVLPSPVGSAS